ncbi:fimbrillin family protein [Prevotella ihumii]|uniref:fimbrillin family protein n=1 Tax=Prevotella ihumii TaxID=1917878 RepID=UPI000981AB37|nr:fimbrillin family protein [Prevotella ihumii]
MSNTPNFIANGEAAKDGTVTVNGVAQHYKKTEPYVQLVGVYPYLQGNNSLEKTGIDKYTLTYDLGAADDATLHKDLMIGKTNVVVNEQEQQPAATIKLHHALTGINFAIGDKCPTGYKIVGIEMQGLAAKGTCDVTFSGNIPTFNWTPSETKESIRLKFPEPIITTQINRTIITGKDTNGQRDNLTIFMVPQQLGSDAKAIIWLKKDDETFKRTKPVNDTDFRSAVKKLDINLNAAKAWKPGQAVVYNIDEELKDADLRYRFSLNSSTNEAQPGEDGLSTAKFNLNSYRYTYNGQLSKFRIDIYAALQTFQIVKYAYEDEAGPHEVVSDMLPDWIRLTVTSVIPRLRGTGKPTFKMELKVDHTNPNYPEGIKKLFITFKQDGNEMPECTVEITNLQPKASK